MQAAARAYPREACGLLFGRPATRLLLRLAPTGYEANGPVSFVISDEEIERLVRLHRERDESLLGCYHSHVAAPPRPTKGDRLGAARRGGLWLIYSIAYRDIGLYRWSGAGFDACPLHFA